MFAPPCLGSLFLTKGWVWDVCEGWMQLFMLRSKEPESFFLNIGYILLLFSFGLVIDTINVTVPLIHPPGWTRKPSHTNRIFPEWFQNKTNPYCSFRILPQVLLESLRNTGQVLYIGCQSFSLSGRGCVCRIHGIKAPRERWGKLEPNH